VAASLTETRANAVTHRYGASVGAFSLSFGAQSVEGVGGGQPDGWSKSDFGGVKCCEKLGRIGRVCVIGIADARQQAEESRVVVPEGMNQINSRGRY